MLTAGSKIVWVLPLEADGKHPYPWALIEDGVITKVTPPYLHMHTWTRTCIPHMHTVHTCPLYTYMHTHAELREGDKQVELERIRALGQAQASAWRHSTCANGR